MYQYSKSIRGNLTWGTLVMNHFSVYTTRNTGKGEFRLAERLSKQPTRQPLFYKVFWIERVPLHSYPGSVNYISPLCKSYPLAACLLGICTPVFPRLCVELDSLWWLTGREREDTFLCEDCLKLFYLLAELVGYHKQRLYKGMLQKEQFLVLVLQQRAHKRPLEAIKLDLGCKM